MNINTLIPYIGVSEIQLLEDRSWVIKQLEGRYYKYRDLVEDALQEAILKMLESEGAYTYNPDKATFKTWLYRLTKDRLTTLIRQQTKVNHSIPQGESA